jgi:hypothetical protein
MVFLIAAGALLLALLTGALIIEPPAANQHGLRFDTYALEMDWSMPESSCANVQRLTSHARRIRLGNPIVQTAPCYF